MKRPEEPLEFPAHFPPTDRWKKFFLGVRGLGPDLSFFKDLKQQQSLRTSDCMNTWSMPEDRELAAVFGHAFQKWLCWPTPYFLPQDRLNTIVTGPEFEKVDNLELQDALAEIEQHLSRKLPKDFWQNSRASSLGELVTEVREKLKMA